MRIPGFRHKWVDSIEADGRKGPPFRNQGDPVILVAIQRPKRILRPKKTIYIYRIRNSFYYADDPTDFRFIPIGPITEMVTWQRRFLNPTTDDLVYLKLYHYVLAKDLRNE